MITLNFISISNLAKFPYASLPKLLSFQKERDNHLNLNRPCFLCVSLPILSPLLTISAARNLTRDSPVIQGAIFTIKPNHHHHHHCHTDILS